MPTIHLETEINASLETAFDLSRSIDLHKISTAHTNEEAVAGVTTGLIDLGETVTWKAKHFGIYLRLTSKITEFKRPYMFVDEMVSGPFAKLHHQHTFRELKGRAKMIDTFEFKSPLGPLGWLIDRIVLTKYLEKLLQKRNALIKRYAENNDLSSQLI